MVRGCSAELNASGTREEGRIAAGRSKPAGKTRTGKGSELHADWTMTTKRTALAAGSVDGLVDPGRSSEWLAGQNAGWS
jgi:hypothetical protein